MKELRQLEFYLKKDIEYYKEMQEIVVIEKNKSYYKGYADAIEYTLRLINIVRNL